MKRFILICLGVATFVAVGVASAEETQINITTNRDTQTTEIKPKEKRKVLILQIIEENWDNLEFIPPKYKIPAGYKPPTKKEAVGHPFISISDRIKINIKKIKEEGHPYLNYMLSEMLPKRKVDTQKIKFFVIHNIYFYGKIKELKADDIFDEAIYRYGGGCESVYFYEKIPEKISLLTEPRMYMVEHESVVNKEDNNKWIPASWSNYRHVRLVEDINILLSDNFGNLKIKYDGKVYDLKIGDKVTFPVKGITITKQEIKNWTDRFQQKILERWGEKSIIGEYDERSIVTKGNLWFKTKVTIINYGYVEVGL